MITMMMNKNDLRKKYLKIRQNLDCFRKEEAKNKIFSHLKIYLQDKKKVLSFVSKETEINTFSINEMLCKEKRLFLPKVEGNMLQIYQVNNLKEELKLSTKAFNLYEPDPKLFLLRKNKKNFLEDLDCVIVPGICFNNQNHRIGFGKGFYDRFLSLKKNNSKKISVIGVCYKEQYSGPQKLDRSLSYTFC